MVSLQSHFHPVADRIAAEMELSLQSNGVLWERPGVGIDMWSGLGGIVASLANLQAAGLHTSGTVKACTRFLDCIPPRLEAAPRPSLHGVMGGQMGVLLCMADAAYVFKHQDSLDWLQGYVPQALDQVLEVELDRSDFASGLAGTLCGAVWLARKLKLRADGAIRELAHRLVNRLSPVPGGLVATADSEAYGPMCGFSHGQSGIAVALLEASVYLNDQLLAALAIDCLNYERAMKFGEHLWPDLRVPPPDARRTSAVQISPGPIVSWPWRPSGTTWCHGTAGMAGALRLFSTRLGRRSFAWEHHRMLTASLTFASRRKSLVQKNACVCHGIGSVVGLAGLSRFGALRLSGQWNRLLAATRAETALILAAVAVGKDEIMRQRFPRSETYLPDAPASARIFHFSYFMGACGLLHVSYNLEHRRPQNDLLLPFVI